MDTIKKNLVDEKIKFYGREIFNSTFFRHAAFIYGISEFMRITRLIPSLPFGMGRIYVSSFYLMSLFVPLYLLYAFHGLIMNYVPEKYSKFLKKDYWFYFYFAYALIFKFVIGLPKLT